MRIVDEKIEKSLTEAIHSVELECGKMTDEEKELLRQVSYGEIRDKEFEERVLILARKMAKEGK